MADLRAGTVVRCIDDHFVDEKSNPFRKSELELPRKGEIYTVRDVVSTPYGVGLRLNELRNMQYFFGNIKSYQEPIFGENRFEKYPCYRALEKQETDEFSKYPAKD